MKTSSQIPAGWDFWRGLTSHYQTGYNIVRQDTTYVTPTVYQTKQIGDIAKYVIADDGFQYEQYNKRFFLVLTPTAPHVKSLATETTGNPPITKVIPHTLPECSSPHPQYLQHVYPDRAGYMGYPTDVLDPADGYTLGTGVYPFEALRGPIFDLPGRNKASFNSDEGVPVNSFVPRTVKDSDNFVKDRWDQLSGNVDRINPETGLLQTYNCDINLANLRRLHQERLESMLSIDVMVGQVFKKLETENKLANTLVIFTSDNGFILGEHRLSNKLLPYDEAIRVPLIIRAPGQESRATNTNLVVNIDLAPTILDYAQLDWTDPIKAIDGRSLKPLLEGLNSSWRQWFLTEGWHVTNSTRTLTMTNEYDWWSFPNYTAVRTANTLNAPVASLNNMTYVEYFDNGWPASGQTYQATTFYDMDAAPYQTVDLSTSTLANIIQQKTQLKWILNGLKACKGNKCRVRDNIASTGGTSLTLVTTPPTRYSSGPCLSVSSGTNCIFDTRSHYYDTTLSKNLESITAYGKYWNYDTATGQQVSSGSLSDNPIVKYNTSGACSPLPCTAIPPGPCYNRPVNSCEFDSRSHYLSNGQTVESITAYGKYWNFKADNTRLPRSGGHGSLSDSQLLKYNAGSCDTQAQPCTYDIGPCNGQPVNSCKFDSRSHFIANGQTVESITAYDKYWNFVNGLPWVRVGSSSSTGSLMSIPRYALGPCQYKTGQNCVFDSRSHFMSSDGKLVESITAYGMYWNFVNDYSW